MHPNSLNLMQKALARYVPGAGATADDPPHVLDVGSRDINGTFRPLIENAGWYYTGLDVIHGLNVDVVADNPYHYPFETGAFDIVISGSVAYAVLDLVAWTNELARCVKPGGLVVIVTPNLSKPPVSSGDYDLWRMTEQGLRLLLENTGVLTEIEMDSAEYDVCASALRVRGEMDEPRQEPQYNEAIPTAAYVPEETELKQVVSGRSHPSQKPKTAVVPSRKTAARKGK